MKITYNQIQNFMRILQDRYDLTLSNIKLCCRRRCLPWLTEWIRHLNNRMSTMEEAGLPNHLHLWHKVMKEDKNVKRLIKDKTL